MIDTGDLRRGITIEIDGVLYQVLEFNHLKMGRGSAQVRMKLRDVRAGHIIDRTVQAGTKFARARVERFGHRQRFAFLARRTGHGDLVRQARRLCLLAFALQDVQPFGRVDFL